MARPAIQPAAVVTSVMLTQSDSVNEPSAGVRAPRKVHRAWAVPIAVIGLVAIVIPMLMAFVPARVVIDKPRCVERDDAGVCTVEVHDDAEFAMVPAEAQPVEPLLSVTGVDTFDDEGQIYFVTVTEPSITLLDWFVTRSNPAVRLRSYIDKYGDQSPEERIEQGQRAMTGAKEWAEFVALDRAGYDVEFVPGAAMVDYVLCLEPSEDQSECLESPPAADVLQPDDVIVELDGQPVEVIDDLLPILAEHQPGDVVPITVERDGQDVETEVELIGAPDEDPPRTIIGFTPVDTSTLSLPPGFGVEFETGDIGGPSAGLAFTLTLLDSLTEGDLVPGKVAVTGTISPDGTVGAIGGLNSKASAVLQEDVKYFLVPASQPDDPASPDSIEAARRVVGDDVEIIPVATLDEALAALERLGGDHLASREDLAAARA